MQPGQSVLPLPGKDLRRLHTEDGDCPSRPWTKAAQARRDRCEQAVPVPWSAVWSVLVQAGNRDMPESGTISTTVSSAGAGIAAAPKTGGVRAGRCCTRARFLCLTFGKKKPETFSGLRMQTGPSRMFPPLYNRRVARKERVNILATGTGSNSADSPAWCLCSNWRMHIPAGGPELGDWERNVCKPPSRMPRAPGAPCTHGRARTVRP